MFLSLSVHVLCLSHPAHMVPSSKILPDVDRSNRRLYYVRDTIIFWQEGIKKIQYENIFVNIQRYYKRHLAPRSPHSPTTSLIRQNEKTNTVQRPPGKPDKHLCNADFWNFIYWKNKWSSVPKKEYMLSAFNTLKMQLVAMYHSKNYKFYLSCF